MVTSLALLPISVALAPSRSARTSATKAKIEAIPDQGKRQEGDGSSCQVHFLFSNIAELPAAI
jgi:hypothetical protein